MKHSLISFSFDQVASLRIFFTFLIFLPFVFKYFRGMTKKEWFYILLLALISNGLSPFLFAKAQTQIQSSVAGIINSTNPLFSLLISVFIFNMPSRKSNFVGIILGLTGSFIIFIPEKLTTDLITQNLFGLLIVLAAILNAYSINVTKFKLARANPVAITAIAYFVLGPFFGFYLFTTDFTTRIATNPYALTSLSCVFVLALFCTAIANVIFNKLIQDTSSVFGSSVAYIIPFVSILLGFLDHEKLMIHQIIGSFVILVGIYLVNRKVKPNLAAILTSEQIIKKGY